MPHQRINKNYILALLLIFVSAIFFMNLPFQMPTDKIGLATQVISDEVIYDDISNTSCLSLISSGSITKVSLNGKSVFPYDLGSSMLAIYTEIPPLIIGNVSYLTTGWTYQVPYNSSKNFITNSSAFINYSLKSPKLIIGGDIYVNNSDPSNPEKRTSAISEPDLDNLPFWRRNYYGIWDVEKIGNKTVFITDGENKNQLLDGTCYDDTIFKTVPCDSCHYSPKIGDCITSYYSFIGIGTHDKGTWTWSESFKGLSGWQWVEGQEYFRRATDQSGWVFRSKNKDWIWGDYFARNHPGGAVFYINGSFWSFKGDGWAWIPEIGDMHFGDKGPVVWPVSGYGIYRNVYDIKWGIRHPSSIVVDDKLYLFYQDLSSGDFNEGNIPGIRIAIMDINDIDQPSFDVWYRNNNSLAAESWNSALPGAFSSGFDSSTIVNDFTISGGNSSNMFFYGTTPSYGDMVCNLPSYASSPYNSYGTIGTVNYFSVAKLKGTDYYIGISDEIGVNYVVSQDQLSLSYKYWIGLKISKDLIHWSNSYVLEDTFVDQWRNHKLAFPRPLSADFTSMKEVDPSGFYIMGTNPYAGYELYYKKISLSVPA